MSLQRAKKERRCVKSDRTINSRPWVISKRLRSVNIHGILSGLILIIQSIQKKCLTFSLFLAHGWTF